LRVNTGRRTNRQPRYPSHFEPSPLIRVEGLSRVHDGSNVRSLLLLMVHQLAGVPSQTLSYPRFTHAFAGLMVIRTSVGNTFPAYLRGWELNDYSHPTSSIRYQAEGEDFFIFLFFPLSFPAYPPSQCAAFATQVSEERVARYGSAYQS